MGSKISRVRRQIHRAHHHRLRTPQTLLPVHRDRRLHPAARPAGLSALRPEDRDPVLDYVLSRLRFQGEKVQTDNGAEFQSSFHWHVLDQGIGHIYIRPATPRLTGKVQRSHRIDAEEFYRLLDGVVEDDTGLFNDKLREWEDYYNYHRPHGGLGGQTPYKRLLQKTQAQPVTGQRQSHT